MDLMEPTQVLESDILEPQTLGLTGDRSQIPSVVLHVHAWLPEAAAVVDVRPNVGVKKLGKWSFEKYHEGFLYPLRKHHHQRRPFS